MPISFDKFSAAVATTWKIGKAIYDWATNAPLKRDFKRFLANLEHRKVLYAEWEYESMPAVLASLDDILRQVRDFRSSHPDNVELGVLLGELIVSLQQGRDRLYSLNVHSDSGGFGAYKALLKIRSELARTLAILCGKIGVSPHGNDLQKFIMDMALVRPRTQQFVQAEAASRLGSFISQGRRMFEIVVSCRGVSEQAALAGVSDVLAEFAERPWHSAVSCRWDGSRILLQARNDYDSTGLALLDEFSDAICACLPIEDSTISFTVESVLAVPDAMSSPQFKPKPLRDSVIVKQGSEWIFQIPVPWQANLGQSGLSGDEPLRPKPLDRPPQFNVMTRRGKNLSTERIRGFLIAALFASAVIGGGAEAAAATKDDISTEAIDRALLETEFTVLGIGASFQQSFLQRQASRSEMACLDSKLTPLVRDHFDSAKKSALTLEELQQGNERASASVFPKIRGYIVDHREQLTAQIESTKDNLSHYFLVTAAIRTNQPPDEYRQVEDFIAWHSQVHPRISEAVGNQTPQFVQDVAIVFVSCRNAP